MKDEKEIEQIQQDYIETLKTVKNFSTITEVSPQAIYKQGKLGRIKIVTIDGFKFVDPKDLLIKDL